MKVLFLAPHPFYQERGTPIAVKLLLKALSKRGDQVDVITYHEGESVDLDNVNIHRIIKIPFVKNIPPGPSWKKIICDIFMFFKVISMAWRRHYDVVHSVEESVLMAMVLKKLFGLPYIYDMDSSVPQQVIEKYPILQIIKFLLEYIEKGSVKHAKAVIVVCDELSRGIEKYKPEKVVVLKDISLLNGSPALGLIDIRRKLKIDGPIIMYIGNLEHYQGIDLLLGSFSLVAQEINPAALVIIGGEESHIKGYRKMAQNLMIHHRVHFLGAQPLDSLGGYLSQADILVSPRVKGNNTPMKVYSYLHSGKPVIATELPTHVQVLNNRVSVLSPANPLAFSEGIRKLVNSKSLRDELGSAGKKMVEENHTESVFNKKVSGLYDWIASTI